MTGIFTQGFVLHLIINTASLLLLLRFIYYRYSPNRDSLMGFFLFGSGVFLVTGLLHDVEMSIGFAFGLFAVFSMLRYRTESISIRDMTYLFLVIVLALMSAVAPVTAVELILLNGFVCTLTAMSETSLLAPRIHEKDIVYENIEYVKPEHYEALLADLSARSGLSVIKAEIGEMDFLRDCVRLKIYYKESNSD